MPVAVSLKVIADHIRACSFTVADGVIPGNEGPRLRAAPHRPPRHPPRLQAGARASRSSTLVRAAGRRDGRGLSRTAPRRDRVTEVLKTEEERFFQTIANGMEILEAALAGGAQVLDGETAFKLHDTFGLARPDRRRLPRARRDGGRPASTRR